MSTWNPFARACSRTITSLPVTHACAAHSSLLILPPAPLKRSAHTRTRAVPRTPCFHHRACCLTFRRVPRVLEIERLLHGRAQRFVHLLHTLHAVIHSAIGSAKTCQGGLAHGAQNVVGSSWASDVILSPCSICKLCGHPSSHSTRSSQGAVELGRC